MVEFTLAPGDKIRAACERAGVPVSQDVLLFEASDAGRPAGECLTEARGKTGSLHIRTDGPSYLYDGLLRTALNALLERGIKSAQVLGEINPILLRRLGFKEQGKGWAGEITDKIFGCCGK